MSIHKESQSRTQSVKPLFVLLVDQSYLYIHKVVRSCAPFKFVQEYNIVQGIYLVLIVL